MLTTILFAVMALITIGLLILFLVGMGGTILIVFGDLIVFVGLVVLIVKLLTRKKHKK